MNIKKEIYNNLVNRLKSDIINLQYKRNHNRYEIKRLAEEQVSIRQEQTALVDLIREVEFKKGK